MATHWLLTASGSYVDSPNDLETWSCGIRLAGLTVGYANVGTLPTISVSSDFSSGSGTGYTWDRTYSCSVAGNTFVPSDYLINQAKPAWDTFMGAVITGKVNLKKLSIYPIGTNGKSEGGNSAHLYYTTPLVGGQGSTVLPLEVSSVLSLYTQRIGRRGRGRIYLPPLAQTALATTGLFTTTARDNVKAGGATLIGALKLDQAGPATLRVRPIITGSPWTDYGVVVKVRSGVVPDRQGRRRRSLPEGYVEQSVTY